MSDPKEQPIGNVFDENKPSRNQTQSLFSFLPAFRYAHGLLMRFRNQDVRLYPDEGMKWVADEINKLDEYEINFLNLPEEIKEQLTQFQNNNVLPLFPKKK